MHPFHTSPTVIVVVVVVVVVVVGAWLLRWSQPSVPCATVINYQTHGGDFHGFHGPPHLARVAFIAALFGHCAGL